MKEKTAQTKEILVLDPKRSNQINIGIRSLPPASRLRDLIEMMDDISISRSEVEKLQSLIPGDEEVAQIKKAVKTAPNSVPLGKAEQFLLMMNSIPGLEYRLKLWAFKVDFKAIEKEICSALLSLRLGMRAVRESQTFARLVAFVLTVGNCMNRSKVPGFQLNYLAKLSGVKDTTKKQSLLHHITQLLMEQQYKHLDLALELAALAPVARNDYEMLESQLGGMEEECIQSLGYISYQKETRKLVSSFLEDAAKRIVSMQHVNRLVTQEYKEFLQWLGLAPHLHKDYPPRKVAALLVEVAREVGLARDRLVKEKVKTESVKQVKEKSRDIVMEIITDIIDTIDSMASCGGYSGDGLEAALVEAVLEARRKRSGRRRTRTATSCSVSSPEFRTAVSGTEFTV